jgi:hypothetical protein
MFQRNEWATVTPWLVFWTTYAVYISALLNFYRVKSREIPLRMGKQLNSIQTTMIFAHNFKYELFLPRLAQISLPESPEHGRDLVKTICASNYCSSYAYATCT